MATAEDFNNDAQGKRFADIVRDPRIDFGEVCSFFDDRDRVRRMIESEEHHDRPALAGVIREFESRPDIRQFFEKYGREGTGRFRQAVGVIVRIVMERRGWRTTGRKGSVGTPATSAAGKRRLAGRNKGGLSIWFNRAERYEPRNGNSAA